jgi:LacI family transcriptional regulator
MLTLRAVERLIALGYKRPALVLDDSIDLLVERRFSAGFKTGQVRLEDQNRIPPFLKHKQAKADPRIFKSWILDSKPDVVLTLYNSVSTWIQELGWQVPEDIGFAQLERRPESPQFAGMDQHNDIAGEAAVDMVISQIHNNESGIPKFPRATLIGATWTESKSILSPLTEVPAAKPSA